MGRFLLFTKSQGFTFAFVRVLIRAPTEQHVTSMLWWSHWANRHRMSVIAKRRGCLHRLAHAAQRGHFPTTCTSWCRLSFKCNNGLEQYTLQHAENVWELGGWCKLVEQSYCATSAGAACTVGAKAEYFTMGASAAKEVARCVENANDVLEHVEHSAVIVTMTNGTLSWKHGHYKRRTC